MEKQPENVAEILRADSLEGFSNVSEEKNSESRVIENEELDVSFKERIIELPKYRQEETGIKRIRRRELIKCPDFFSDNSQEEGYEYSDKTREIWNFITDNKISLGTKLGHVVAWKVMNGVSQENNKMGLRQIDQHIDDDLYFGRVLPENRGDYGKYIDDGLEISDLFTTVGDYVWTDRILTPVYFFGTDNPAFRKYLESVLGNEEILNKIKKRWEIAGGKESGTIVYPGSIEFDTEFTRSLSHHVDFGFNATAKIDRQRKTCVENDIPIFIGQRVRNISFLRILSEGIVTASPYPFGEATIPAVSSVGVKPLRWCHSDLAIIPTKKSLNVLFFETEDSARDASI